MNCTTWTGIEFGPRVGPTSGVLSFGRTPSPPPPSPPPPLPPLPIAPALPPPLPPDRITPSPLPWNPLTIPTLRTADRVRRPLPPPPLPPIATIITPCVDLRQYFELATSLALIGCGRAGRFLIPHFSFPRHGRSLPECGQGGSKERGGRRRMGERLTS